MLMMSCREFNELVNMTAQELKDWLSQDESAEAGWTGDGGSGETVGHERSMLSLIFILATMPLLTT